MFFVLSKVISFLVSPFFWIFILLLCAIFIRRWRLKMLVAATVLLFVLGNGALFSLCIRWWEAPLKSIDSIDFRNRSVVVLGGYCSYSQEANRTRFNQSADRLMQALLVWQRQDSSMLIISGGSANVLIKERPEGAVVYQALKQMGFDTVRIRVDSLSRNTYENGVETASIVQANSLSKRIVLVTSAWHMPRAMRCFAKLGFDVEPLSTDPLTPVEILTFQDYLIPSLNTIQKWDSLLHEWCGLIIYRLKGYC
jgi:uncharacterized SAM-binding protein YcdF (DUF218 family)